METDKAGKDLKTANRKRDNFMAAKKERWGVYIELESAGLAREADGSASTIYNYKVIIGKYDRESLKPGKAFVSNPKISVRIAKVQKMLNFNGMLPIGNMSFLIERTGNLIKVGNYYPFYHFMLEGSPKGSNKNQDAKIFKMLTGMGLANKIELRALKDLQKKLPGFMYVPGNKHNDKSRIRQLGNRDSELNKPVPIQAEIQRIVDRVGGFAKKKMWRRKAKRRILAPIKKVADFLKNRQKSRK